MCPWDRHPSPSPLFFSLLLSPPLAPVFVSYSPSLSLWANNPLCAENLAWGVLVQHGGYCVGRGQNLRQRSAWRLVQSLVVLPIGQAPTSHTPQMQLLFLLGTVTLLARWSRCGAGTRSHPKGNLLFKPDLAWRPTGNHGHSGTATELHGENLGGSRGE